MSDKPFIIIKSFLTNRRQNRSTTHLFSFSSRSSSLFSAWTSTPSSFLFDPVKGNLLISDVAALAGADDDDESKPKWRMGKMTDRHLFLYNLFIIDSWNVELHFFSFSVFLLISLFFWLSVSVKHNCKVQLSVARSVSACWEVKLAIKNHLQFNFHYFHPERELRRPLMMMRRMRRRMTMIIHYIFSGTYQNVQKTSEERFDRRHSQEITCDMRQLIDLRFVIIHWFILLRSFRLFFRWTTFRRRRWSWRRRRRRWRWRWWRRRRWTG